MLIWTLFVACGNDHYLSGNVIPETEAGTVPVVEIVCSGPEIAVAPDTLEFFSILSPFAEDIDLLTDTMSATVTNNCNADMDIYITASGGEIGRFSLVRAEGDRDGAGSGEYQFTVPAFETHMRVISYTADARATLAGYDHGTFNAYVVADGMLGFHASASLEATVINILFAE